MVAHGGTSVAGSFIQTLTMVDVATGWRECLPLVTRDGSLVVEAMKHAQSLFPWLLRNVNFDTRGARSRPDGETGSDHYASTVRAARVNASSKKARPDV